MLEVAEKRDEAKLSGAFISQTIAEAVLQSGGQNADDFTAVVDAAIHDGIAQAFSVMAQQFADTVLGAERSARCAERTGYRSGTRHKQIKTPWGKVAVSMVKSRAGLLVPPLLQQERFAPALKKLCRDLWTDGLSVRDISRMSARVDALGFGDVSHQTVYNSLRDSAAEVMAWLNRPVRQDICYLVLDAKHVSIKRETAQKEPLLVAVGITEDGHKEILDVMPAPSESFESWRTFVARLVNRGLPVEQLRLVTTDGCPGLIRAVEEVLPKVRRQRCTTHKVRNVVGRSPAHLKSTAPKEASQIWKAPSRVEAERRAKAFIAKYEDDYPTLANIVRDDFEATLAFYALDSQLWPSLRTTNVQERINREFSRKFDEVGALKGDTSVTRVAVMVAMRHNELRKDDIVKGFKKRKKKKS